MGESKGSGGHGSGASVAGRIWAIGWLFTIGYVPLPFWKAVLALMIWPYFLGTTLAAK
jgi:hypothetical protein